MNDQKISAYVIAFNEEDKIEDAMKSLDWVDEVVLIDSFSKDRTADIAEKYGARIVQVEFNGFGNLRNRALAECKHSWVFSLDADERVTHEAMHEILGIVASPISADAYLVPRTNYFLGKRIKYSGWYPNYRQPQLFKKGSLTYTDDVVHEGYVLDENAQLSSLTSSIVQIPFKDLSEVIEKMNRYSSLGADKLKTRGKKISFPAAIAHASWAFLKHYIAKRGFLDGVPGFVIAFGNFEGTFYRYLKAWEKEH